MSRRHRTAAGTSKVEVRRRLVDRFEGNPASGGLRVYTTGPPSAWVAFKPFLFAAALDNDVTPVTWLAEAEAQSNASGLPATVSWLIR